MKRVRLVSLTVARPKAVLAVWLALIGTLALLGLGLESKLHRSDLAIPDTTTERTVESIEPKFGQNFDELVLLRGPRSALDRQGPRISAELERIPGVSLIAPWAGAGDSLRPDPRSALIVIRANGDFDSVSREVAPQIREIAKRAARPPLRSYVSGYPDIADGIHGGTVEAIEQAELIAVPLLIIILLLVFKSPIAAALPLFVGLSTIGAARGVLALINGFYPLDALALNVASMMGLALGVDYALLMVSRYREELREGLAPRQAAREAAERTGHTILSAGVALGVAMTTAIFIVPGSLLVGVGVALISVVVISVLSALSALPAALALLGTNVNRWAFGDVRRGSRVGGLAVRTLKHPAFAVAFVLLIVGLLSTPLLSLETGPPDPRGLPPGSEAREDYLAVKDELGGGWIAPYEIGVTTDDGPLTEHSRLVALDRFQRRLVSRPDVAAVLGPGQILRRTKPLQQTSKRLASTRRFLAEGLESQRQLARGLTRIGSGVDQMQGGLSTAAAAADGLEDGGSAAAAGARLLEIGLDRASEGAANLREGMTEAKAGVGSLASGSERASKGADGLEQGLARARPGLVRGLPQIDDLRRHLDEASRDLERLRTPAQATQRGLEHGLAALAEMSPTAQGEPAYSRAYSAFSGALAAASGTDPQTGQPVQPGYSGLDAALAAASETAAVAADDVATLHTQSRTLAAGLGRLRAGSARLARGVGRLGDGAERLLRGFQRLGGGDEALAGGLDRLGDGSGALASGLTRLAAGAGALRDGLTEGAGQTVALDNGVDRVLAGALVFRAKTGRLADQSRQTVRLTPVFKSGYFTLAALDRARPELRRTASFALNLDRGGGGARISVIGYGEPQKAGHPLREVLERELGPLSKQIDARAELGGTATGLQDFDIATADRLPQLALALSLVTFVILIFVLRSLVLPAIAVLFNLLTVAAAFGVTVLCFEGSSPLLGGPGFIDAITAFGIFSIMFGLSIDYEVFLLLRMREGYLRTGSTEQAIEYGVERTAGVITGAALIMTVVFLSFATTGITAARQLGLALSVAVIVDATLIRLVLLPGAMKLLGRANWWLPKPRSSP
jgi:RND superfamily putative drug exporter